MQINEMKEKLKKTLKPKRYKHSIGVMETAVKMAKRFNADETKAMLCGLLHDCAKYMSPEEGYEFCKENNIELDEVSKVNYSIVHQYIGAYLAKSEYGVCDKEVLSAIACHTTGKENMSTLDKILCLADMIEPTRKENPYDGLFELEKLCFEDLDKAFVFGFDLCIKHVIDKKELLHIDSIRARNDVLKKMKKI